MSGAISQIQVVYDPEEDRILFRLNSTEQQQFRFWLTRRYTILLLKVLAEHLDKDPDVTVQGTPTAREAVRSFKQEEAVRNANYAESFREDANELPLGQDVLTAYRLSYSVKNGILHLGIQHHRVVLRQALETGEVHQPAGVVITVIAAADQGVLDADLAAVDTAVVVQRRHQLHDVMRGLGHLLAALGLGGEVQ